MTKTPTEEAVDLDGLQRLFERIPPGPYDALHRQDGWEVRQIDTDPRDKHHWPYRLCERIAGQAAECDDAVFPFIAGVINAWPTLLSELSRLQAERDRAVEERARLARFADVALRALWDGHDFDAEDIQDAALKHGLIRATVFNPNIHIDHLGVGAKAGDEWFVPSEWVEALFTLPPPVKEAEPVNEVIVTPADLQDLLVAAYERGAHDTHEHYQPDPDPCFKEAAWDYVASLDFTATTRPHRATPPALQARALEGALREAQSVLAMLVEPGAIQQTTVINAYAAAKTAEAKARAALTGEKGQ